MYNQTTLQINKWLEGQLVSGNELKNVRNARAKEHYFKNDVPVCDIDSYREDGWEVHKETKKNRVTLRKDKPRSTKFEDRVWKLFAKLGFLYLNKDEHCELPTTKPYNESNLKPKECHQIDVLAIDEDCAFFIECKSAESENKTKNFRQVIENLASNHAHYCNALNGAIEHFSGTKYKSIFVTERYVVSSGDIKLMNEKNIFYLNEDDITYYEQLAEQIGSAAKYQFCAHVFKDNEIKGMNCEVPAIRGKMGGHYYYSFSIEPERLLKMSFIAHRRKGDASDGETYQRLIKKSRLQSVKDFVNNGNYFPNSIIVNITNERSNGREKALCFRSTKEQAKETESQLGILELPKKYGCAFVIDGQHRLYGYADSKYARTNTIPVVLFENLSSEEQIKLFMEINENQKSVPKELKNTLYYILNSDSKDPKKKQDALMLKIATDLGTRPSSPLFNYVKLLEHESSATKQITTTAIHEGLRDGVLFNKYTSQKKKPSVYYGLFAQNDLDEMRKDVYIFVETCLKHIYENCKEEWEIGKGSNEEPGILTINPSIKAILKVLSDIARTINKVYSLSPLIDKNDFIEKALFYLDPLIRYINSVTVEKKKELRTHIGAGGPEYYAMTFRQAIVSVRKDLDIDVQEMNRYFEDESRKYNSDSADMISKLRPIVKKFLIKMMQTEYPNDEEYVNALPDKMYKALNKLYVDYKVKNKEDKTSTIVDMMDFEHFTKVLSFYSAETFNKYKSPTNKISHHKVKEHLSYIESLSKKNFTRDSIKQAEYDELKNRYNDLLSALSISD